MLLVGHVITVGVADLGLQVVPLAFVVIPDALPEGPLHIRIDIHLDGAVFDSLADLFTGRAGAAVEDDVDGVRAGCVLFLNIIL